MLPSCWTLASPTVAAMSAPRLPLESTLKPEEPFFLAKGWGNIPFWEVVWKLVRWWPEITKQAAMVAPGALFMVPVKFTAKFEQIKLK